MKYELCICCVHKEYCKYREGRTQVLQCEEFEGIRPDTATRSGSARGRRKEERASARILEKSGSAADRRSVEPAESIQSSEESK